MPRSWVRLDGIDLLRGLAIFLVLMNHVNMRLALARVPYTHAMPAQLAQSLFWSGQFGVQIFFAVSGFLITSTTLRRWGSLRDVSIRDFYALRFARIAPLLLALLAVLSALHFAGLKDFVVRPKTGGLGRALVAALTFHVNVLEAQRGYLPANWDILWSLSVEETFYFFFPMVCRVFRGGKWMVGLLFVFVACGPFARTVLAYNGVWREYSYLGGMDAIALGCLTALLAVRVRFGQPMLSAFASVGLVLVGIVIGGRLTEGVDMSVIAAGTCLIMIASAQTEWRSPASLRPLLTAGRRSYEIYLTHMFVVFAFFDWFVGRGTHLAEVPALFVVTITLAIALGAAVARFYSEPMNKMLRARWSERCTLGNSDSDKGKQLSAVF